MGDLMNPLKTFTPADFWADNEESNLRWLPMQPVM
jgi:hypothetical protein